MTVDKSNMMSPFKFGAVWTWDTFNIIKIWIDRPPALCSSGGHGTHQLE